MIQVARPLVEPTLRRIEGLPGILTSTVFKLVSVRKEVEQLVDFVQKLHDRQALVKREARRRFLGGEGFVAWPGPALRTFVDEFIIHNRMMSGGFVIDGRTVTLADLRSPVLYFVGTRDEIARPQAVRAIARAAPAASTFQVALPAGHFGLVVGGVGSLVGSVVGGIFYVLVDNSAQAISTFIKNDLGLQFDLSAYTIFGILLILLMYLMPQGIVGGVYILFRRLRRG